MIKAVKVTLEVMRDEVDEDMEYIYSAAHFNRCVLPETERLLSDMNNLAKSVHHTRGSLTINLQP